MSRRIDDLVRLAGQQVDWALIVEPAAGRGEPQRNLPTVQTVWLECSSPPRAWKRSEQEI
jgi:hypothetical protein